MNDPRMIPKGSSAEVQYSGNNRPAGIYYHPGADKFIETSGIKTEKGMSYHQDEGSIQADAFVQIGYRPATDEEVDRYLKQKEDNSAQAEKRVIDKHSPIPVTPNNSSETKSTKIKPKKRTTKKN